VQCPRRRPAWPTAFAEVPVAQGSGAHWRCLAWRQPSPLLLAVVAVFLFSRLPTTLGNNKRLDTTTALRAPETAACHRSHASPASTGAVCTSRPHSLVQPPRPSSRLLIATPDLAAEACVMGIDRLSRAPLMYAPARRLLSMAAAVPPILRLSAPHVAGLACLRAPFLLGHGRPGFVFITPISLFASALVHISPLHPPFFTLLCARSLVISASH